MSKVKIFVVSTLVLLIVATSISLWSGPSAILVSAATPPALDPNCQGYGSLVTGSSNPIVTTSMTLQAKELIIVVITDGASSCFSTRTFTVSDSFGRSYTQRGTTLTLGSFAEQISEFYLVNDLSHTGSFTVTVTPDSYSRNFDVQAFGIMGANTASPFDPNSGLPKTGSSISSSIPTVTTVSTTNANDIILGLEGQWASTLQTTGSYFTGTILHNNNGEGNNVGYKTVTSALSSSSIAFGTSVSNWVMLVDAITSDQISSTTTLGSLSSINLGASKTATATVTPTTATGTVRFDVSTDSGTTWNPYGATKTLSSGSATSDSYTPPNAGTNYRFRAVYLGDTYVSSSTSSSQSLTVNKIVATISASSFAPLSPITLGTSVTVSATVTGAGGVTAPSGNVQFQVKIGGGSFTNFGSLVALSGTSASITYTPQNVNTYSFDAIYQGDNNYNSGTTGAASGILTVNKGTATVNVPSLNPSASIGLGSSVTCSVTVSGGGATPTGNVQFQVSTNSGSSWNNLGSAVALSGGSATSTSYTPTAQGSNYQFKVSTYAGDSNYNTAGASSAVTLTVDKASPTISTVPPSGASVNVGFIDSATLLSATGNAGGTVTYTLYSGVSPSGTQIDTDVKIVSNGLVPNSKSFSVASPGSYYFIAVYSGDANNYGVTGTAESFSVISGGSGSTSLNPVADSNIRAYSGYAGTNYGTDTTFSMGLYSSYERDGLVKFDLTGIPVGSTITSASLHLYYSSVSGSATVSVYKITADWTETGVTWNNKPGTGALTTSQTVGATGSISYNVLADVQAFVSGSATNYGWILKAPSGSHDANSKEATSNKPVLSITYSLPSLYSITSSASAGGSINPSTVQYLNQGQNSPTFTISPNNGYHITDVVLDGSTHLGAVTSYQFTNVQAAHSIAASFAINTYAITVTQAAGGHGTIAPGTTDVIYDGTQAFTITPVTGYHIASVTVDGSSAPASSPYTFSHVTAAHTITASFAIDIHSTILTISVDPKIVNKYNSPHATVSGYLKSQGTGLNLQTVTISYNDGRNGWIECGHPTTGSDGSFTVDFPVTPDFANGFVAFEAKYSGDAGNGYAAATPVYTGAIGGDDEGNLNVLPEYIFGGLAALGACLVGFAVFKKRRGLSFSILRK